MALSGASWVWSWQARPIVGRAMLHGGRRQPRWPRRVRRRRWRGGCGCYSHRRCGRWWGCRGDRLRQHTRRRAGRPDGRGSPRRVGHGHHLCVLTRGCDGRRRGCGLRRGFEACARGRTRHQPAHGPHGPHRPRAQVHRPRLTRDGDDAPPRRGRQVVGEQEGHAGLAHRLAAPIRAAAEQAPDAAESPSPWASTVRLPSASLAHLASSPRVPPSQASTLHESMMALAPSSP